MRRPINLFVLTVLALFWGIACSGNTDTDTAEAREQRMRACLDKEEVEKIVQKLIENEETRIEVRNNSLSKKERKLQASATIKDYIEKRIREIAANNCRIEFEDLPSRTKEFKGLDKEEQLLWSKLETELLYANNFRS